MTSDLSGFIPAKRIIELQDREHAVMAFLGSLPVGQGADADDVAILRAHVLGASGPEMRALLRG